MDNNDNNDKKGHSDHNDLRNGESYKRDKDDNADCFIK